MIRVPGQFVAYISQHRSFCLFLPIFSIYCVDRQTSAYGCPVSVLFHTDVLEANIAKLTHIHAATPAS